MVWCNSNSMLIRSRKCLEISFGSIFCALMFDLYRFPICITPPSPTLLIIDVRSRSSILMDSCNYPLDDVCHVVIISSDITRRSFGMVCFEVATGMEPFPGKGKIHVMNLVGVMGERPQLPVTSNPSPGVALLMKKCWQQDPNKRPDGFDPVVTDLENALRSAGGDPRESSGSSRSEPSNIAKTKDDNSPVIQSAAQQDRRPSNEASRTQTTTVRTFLGAAGAPHLLYKLGGPFAVSWFWYRVKRPCFA